jgi:hypothetical protein
MIDIKLLKKQSLLRSNTLGKKSTFLDPNQIKSLNKIQRHVKFDGQVEVVLVESWKQYNSFELGGNLDIIETTFNNPDCKCKCLIM